MDVSCYLLSSLVQERQWLHYFDPQISNNTDTTESAAHPDKVGLNFNTIRNGACTTQIHYA